MANWTDHSLKLAMQTAFGTANTTDGDFVTIEAEVPKVTFETDMQELELMTGVVGAAPERIAGRRHGSITFKLPLEGLKSGYDPTAEGPGAAPVSGHEVIPPWLALLANAIGSNLSAVTTNAQFWRGLHLSWSEYTAGGVSSAAAGPPTTVVLDNATASNKVLGGEFFLSALTATATSLMMGWVKTKAVQTLTLFDALTTVINDAAAHVYPQGTAYGSSEVSSTKALSMRWVGNDTTFAYLLQDCICSNIKITWDVGAVPEIEFTYKFYNYSMDKTKGGLVVPSAYERVPQLVGGLNGRATLGTWNAAGTTLTSATQCGLEACTWEWSAELRETKCHSATQGVSAVSIVKPRVKASFSIPHDSGDTVYDAAGSAGNTGQHQWQSRLELGTRISIGAYVGATIGRVWSHLLPSSVITSVPAVEDRNGAICYTVSVEAGAYTQDTTDTAETSADSPLDSPFRVALA